MWVATDPQYVVLSAKKKVLIYYQKSISILSIHTYNLKLVNCLRSDRIIFLENTSDGTSLITTQKGETATTENTDKSTETSLITSSSPITATSTSSYERTSSEGVGGVTQGSTTHLSGSTDIETPTGKK